MKNLLNAAAVILAGGLLSTPANAQSWDEVVDQAREQTVFMNAWAGSEKINAYIAWAGERVAMDYGITLRHVKIDDTATVVSRVLAEKAAGKDDDGSVDLYLGPTSPEGKEKNSIKTIPGKTWHAYFRWYDPTEGYWDGSWKLNDIELII